jgi:3-oxoacyl-[acyl-carrier protein] reductase
LALHYSKSADSAEQVARRCQALGAEAFTIAGDVSIDADCHNIVERTFQKFGRIDALANCAGTTVFLPMNRIDEADDEAFLKVFQINALGPFKMSRAAARRMQTGSAIVNVSSIAGENGRGSSYAYVASKAALNALTLSLARSLAPTVRVNAVLPGMIDGRWMREGLGESSFERVRSDFASLSALERICQPEEIADAIVWLLEPGSVVTGQLIRVDAGYTLGRDRNQSS